MAFLAILVMLLGGAAAATPDVVRGTWYRLTPTSVLYAMDGHIPTGNAPRVRYTPTAAEKLRRELRSRFRPEWHAQQGADPSFWTTWPMRVESPLLRAKAHRVIGHSSDRDTIAMAIDCLGAIGIKPKDVPVLRPLVGPSADAWLRYRAAAVLLPLGPKAAIVVQDVADAIAADTDWTAPVTEMQLLAAFGPSAAPATDHLRLVLWTPVAGVGHPRISSRLAEDARIHALRALGAIGPSAAPVVPDILELLSSDPHLIPAGACAIAQIDPDGGDAQHLVLSILMGSDVQAHALIKESLTQPQCASLRSALISTLVDRAGSPDGCHRLAAARALAALDALPAALWDVLLSDAEPNVRLIAAAAARAAPIDPGVARRVAQMALEDEDPVIRHMASKGAR